MDTSLDHFMKQQRDRLAQELETQPKIRDQRPGTDLAVEEDNPLAAAYIRTETVGHRTPQGRKEFSVGNKVRRAAR